MVKDKCPVKYRQNLLKHWHCSISFFSRKKRRMIKQSDGFLTETDSLINYMEWHALFYGISLTLLSFLVSPVFMILQVWMLYVITTTDVSTDQSRIIYEIGKETPYYIGGIGFTFVVMYLLGFTFESGMEQLLLELLTAQ